MIISKKCLASFKEVTVYGDSNINPMKYESLWTFALRVDFLNFWVNWNWEYYTLFCVQKCR